MPESEKDLDLQARVMALEYLLKQVLWNVAVVRADLNDGDIVEAIQDVRDLTGNVDEEMSLTAYPPLDPALSDHLADVSRGHAKRVLRELVAEMEAQLGEPF